MRSTENRQDEEKSQINVESVVPIVNRIAQQKEDETPVDEKMEKYFIKIDRTSTVRTRKTTTPDQIYQMTGTDEDEFAEVIKQPFTLQGPDSLRNQKTADASAASMRQIEKEVSETLNNGLIDVKELKTINESSDESPDVTKKKQEETLKSVASSKLKKAVSFKNQIDDQEIR